MSGGVVRLTGDAQTAGAMAKIRKMCPPTAAVALAL
jgi:hypothetical protein